MRQQIFNMGRVHELKAAPFDEWNVVARQLDFQVEGVKARTEQHGDVPQRHALLAQFQNFLADELRLHLLAVGLDQLGPGADAFAREQALLVAFLGSADDLVGDVQDRLGAAIILFQLDDPRAGKMLGKVHDVAKVGAANE